MDSTDSFYVKATQIYNLENYFRSVLLVVTHRLMLDPPQTELLSVYCHIITKAEYLCYKKSNKPMSIRGMTFISNTVIHL